MLKKILLGVVAVIALFLVYVALQPADYFVAREIKIQAPAEKIWPWLNSAKKSNEWMPWASMDPHLQMSFSGPEEGVGTTASWSSDGQMGVGSSTVIESIPFQVVKIKIEYKKPFEGVQDAEFGVTTVEGESTVKWSVRGQNNFIGRMMCVFFNMDKMVGGSFEQGLAKLKSLVDSN